MLDMFLYNWQIREDWFDFCKNISEEDLTKKTGWWIWKFPTQFISCY